MSVGPMTGIAAGAAGTPLTQAKGTDAERTAQEVRGLAARRGGQLKAESAAGVGEADGQDHQSDDRDADGRVPWRIRTWRKRPRPTRTPRVPLRRPRIPAAPPAISWT